MNDIFVKRGFKGRTMDGRYFEAVKGGTGLVLIEFDSGYQASVKALDIALGKINYKTILTLRTPNR